MKRMLSRWGALGLGICLPWLGSCAGAVESTRLEDQVRREVPVAICLMALERYGSGGVVPTLKSPDYWSMVLPSYNATDKTLDTSAVDCAGRPVFSDPIFATSKSGIVPAGDEQVQVTDAPGKFKIVWLKTHEFEDEAAGPVVLARPFAGRAEVYAIGVYRGATATARFELERLGSKVFVTASDGRCAQVKGGQPCQTSMRVFLMNVGRLSEAATLTTDRVRTVASANGTPVEYRFTAIPDFTTQGFRLKEQLAVQDPSQPAVQKSTLERVFKLTDEGKLVPAKKSLWEQVMADKAPSPPSPQ